MQWHQVGRHSESVHTTEMGSSQSPSPPPPSRLTSTPPGGEGQSNEQEPQGSNYQGMSIHNQKGFDSDSVTFLPPAMGPPKARPEGREQEGHTFMPPHSQPAAGVSVAPGSWKWDWSLSDQQLLRAAFFGCAASDKLDFNVLNRRKKISPCSLLLPFLEPPAGTLCHSSWLPAVEILHLMKRTYGEKNSRQQ